MLGKKPLKSHQICPSLILNHTETSNKLCGKFWRHNLNMIQSREHSRIWEITRHCIELWPRHVQILIAEKLILLLSILLWTSVAKRNLAENFFFLFWFFFDFLAVSSMVTYPRPQFVENSFCLCMVLLGLNDVFTDFLCLQISKSHHVCEFADVLKKCVKSTKLTTH